MKYALVFLADWANGLFALLLAAYVTGTEILWWHVPVALLLSHLPDVDAIPELVRRGRVSASRENPSDHRTVLHYPALSIPLGIALGVFFGFWGWLICFSVILHLLNDFYGTGWGLPLLWPFSHKHFKFLGRKANRLKVLLKEEGDWGTLEHDERKLRLVVVWSHEELPKYIKRWGIDDWIGKYYLRSNWVNRVEYTLFVCACVLIYFSLF